MQILWTWPLQLAVPVANLLTLRLGSDCCVEKHHPKTMRALALGFVVVATGCADAFSASGAASSVVMSPSSLQLRGSCAPQALGLGTAGIRSCVAANGARVRMSQNTMESAKQFYPATESTLTAEQVLVLGSFAPRGAPCTV